MRHVQQVAVGLFETQGFDETTVEDIAKKCGMSAMTIYRQFGNKEATVLWDELDRRLDAELEARLHTSVPRNAFEHAVVATLCEREDREMLLRRLRLVYATPAIWRRAAEQERRDRTELANAFAAANGRRTPALSDVCDAAACLVALDVALDHWQKSNGKSDLAELIGQALALTSSPD